MTMVELMVSLAIVMLIIGAATTAYLKLLRTYKTQGRLAESYMANLTGLELLRYDIEMAGFGLPIDVTGVAYTETVDTGIPLPAGIQTLLNDATANPPTPRALAHLNNVGRNNSDVLVIKSSAAKINTTSKKWSMIIGATNPVVKMWGGTVTNPVMDFAVGDMFIVLDNGYQLQTQAGNWFFTVNNTGFTPITPILCPLPPTTGKSTISTAWTARA